MIDLSLTKIGTFLVIVDKGGEKSHKDIAKSKKDIKRERESTKIEKSQRERKDIVRRREIKFEHISRGSKLMDYLLHLYVH